MNGLSAGRWLGRRPGNDPVTVVCPSITVKTQSATLDVADCVFTGEIKADGDVVAGGISLQNLAHQVQGVRQPTREAQ